MVGSFPWRVSSSPRIGFGRGGGPGEDPLDDGEGGVGGRGGDGPRGGGGEGDCFRILKWHWIGIGVIPNWSCFGNFHASILLTEGGDVVSAGGGSVLGSGFRVVAGDNIGSSFIGVDGRVVTNLRSYGDSVSRGSVSSGVGSARNMRRRRSSVQYQSNGVNRRDLSSLFIRVSGSSQTTC